MRTKLTLTAAFVALTFGQAAFAANQNLSTDVLVVGAGSAGLTAAVQAAEKGVFMTSQSECRSEALLASKQYSRGRILSIKRFSSSDREGLMASH